MSTETEQNRQLVGDAFAAWGRGDSKPFFAIVADDVTWTVIGTTPISGTYTSKKAFLDGAVRQLSGRLQGPILADVKGVNADGDMVFLRWEGKSTGPGERPYEQTYCWALRLAGGKVVEVTAYLDTELVSAMFA
jgi:ketosteroid isomerase-like protein